MKNPISIHKTITRLGITQIV